MRDFDWDSRLPDELVGPGTILTRQTTYWDVRISDDLEYRIHFSENVEHSFAEPPFATIQILERHPLLVKHHESPLSVFFSKPPANPELTAHELQQHLRHGSAHWRSLADHGRTLEEVERTLRLGHGLLLHAPASVYAQIEAALRTAGCEPYTLGESTPMPGKKLLLLGKSYVIADAFAVRPL